MPKSPVLPAHFASAPIAVNIISGLLGSGKTTTVKHLLSQKPQEAQWAIVVNEFGEIDIDGAELSALTKETPVHAVQGGCICCTAQLGLTRALQTLLQTHPHIERLLIEPTGLGHPAQIIDTLRQLPTARPLQLQSQLCVLDPRHLTPERWQKSAVMRDLVTLADVIVLNKTDQCSPEQIKTAQQFLTKLYPPKSTLLTTQFGQIPLDMLEKPHQVAPFQLLQGLSTHRQQMQAQTSPVCPMPESPPPCQLIGCQQRQIQSYAEHWAIGWQWSPQIQLNRIAFNQWIEILDLLRGKGLLRTGKEWKTWQYSEHTPPTWHEIAWRQDNRLELIFTTPQNPENIENALNACLRQRPI